MNVGIISLGLIGGSILKALAGKEHNLICVTRNKETIEKAKSHTRNVSDDYETLKDCDIVFVASPINKTIEVLNKLEDIVNPACIVLDCASVKEFVMKKPRPYKFIGSHPMAGTENNGFDASFKELFNGAKWVLTPSDNISEQEIETVKQIIEKTKAQVIIADAKEHDIAVALISHMPLIVSQAIMDCASDNKLALKLASSGFRDMTRLSMSNLEMAEDMKKFNAENIDISIEKLISSINFLKNAKVLQKSADIKNIRKSMYSQEGKNIL